MGAMPSSVETCALTLPCCLRDFVEWRKGRSVYAVWALDLGNSLLSGRSEGMRRHFAKYLLADYCRQPHLTVGLCGFPAPKAMLEDDYGRASLVRHVQALKSAQLSPFMIDVGEADSFSSAAYFSVTDSGRALVRLRDVLGASAVSNGLPFVPHVTFGLYRAAVPLLRVVQEMRTAERSESISLEIGKLSLMAYQASEIGGPLRTLAEFDLRHGCFEIREARQMDDLFGRAWQTLEFA